jgi:hypothetical protein
MKTYLLTVTEGQEEVIKALAKALQFEIQVVSESDEDAALLKAMEEGKTYGRLSEGETKSFLDDLEK